MLILGIDPGATTGWCFYDTSLSRVLASGTSRDIEVVAEIGPILARTIQCDEVVIERPKGYGPTYPQVVEAGYVCGYIVAALSYDTGHRINEMTRREVCQILTDAVHGVVRVKNDATAWAALLELHGDGADKKPKRNKGIVIEPGGPLGEVKSHARAALAVAVAWGIGREAVRIA